MGTVRVRWHSWGKVCVEEEKWGGIAETEDQMVETFSFQAEEVELYPTSGGELWDR